MNHPSKDALLTAEHPEWYVRDEQGELVSPSVTDPDDPTNVTVWGDLAEIDNEGSADREGLWGFWAQLVRDSIELGFRGFRCDAAYMVPAALWRHPRNVLRRILDVAGLAVHAVGGVHLQALATGAIVHHLVDLRRAEARAGIAIFLRAARGAEAQVVHAQVHRLALVMRVMSADSSRASEKTGSARLLSHGTTPSMGGV